MAKYLSKRQKEILFYINQIKNLKVQDLCLEFEISDKTARNEIKEINNIADNVVIKSSNLGISIDYMIINIVRLLRSC